MKIKSFLESNIISGLIVGIIVGLVLYFLDKTYSKKIWCTQETKSFQKEDYQKKDLAILLDECSDTIKKYEVLENILYDSNNTDKFSSVINRLYVNSKIDKEQITDFTDISLNNFFKNSNYNFDNVLVNTKNNLPTLEDKIAKYLSFTKDILFTSYSGTQQETYFYIFLYLFKHTSLLNNIEINQNIYNRFEGKSSNGGIKLNSDFIYLQKICKRVGRTQSREIIINSKNIINTTLMDLFNSYKTKNKKDILLKDLKSISSKILNFKDIVKSPKKDYIEHVYNIMTYAKLYPLILHELAYYKLDDNTLKEIFNNSKNVNKIIHSFIFDDNLIHKLIFRMFNGDMRIITDKTELYNKLMVEAYKKGDITINQQLMSYFAIHQNKELLNELLKFKKDNLEIKRSILHSFIIGQKLNDYYGYTDTLDSIQKIINKEEKFENKSILLRDSLLLNNNELIKIALKHIKDNRDYYLKELNEESYTKTEFYYNSIFSYLAQTRPSKKYLMEEKISLFFDFLQNISNNENKIHLLSAIQTFLNKDSITQKTQLKKLIKKEKDIALRQEMLSKLKF